VHNVCLLALCAHALCGLPKFFTCSEVLYNQRAGMDQSCSGTNIKYLGFCHVTCTVPTFHRKEVISVWYWHLPPRCFWSCCFIILVFIAFPETSLVKLSNQHYHSAYANIGKFVCCLQWPACHGLVFMQRLPFGTSALPILLVSCSVLARTRLGLVWACWQICDRR